MSVNTASERVANEVVVPGELRALDEFIAGVLRRAHQSLDPDRSQSEHRAIFQVARLFAEELERTDPSFDRLRFIESVAEGFSRA